MQNADPAPGAVRSALDSLPFMLRHQRRIRIGLGLRRGILLADRAACDITGGGQVGDHQGRRHALHVSDVVEVCTHLVCRQPFGRIDAQAQQFINKTCVFGPIQPLERARACALVHPGVRVESVLERCDEMVDHVLVPRHFLRRHLPGPQFADHLLGDDGIHIGFVRIEGREVDAGLQRVLVVTGEADLFDERIRITGFGRPGESRHQYQAQQKRRISCSHRYPWQIGINSGRQGQPA